MVSFMFINVEGIFTKIAKMTNEYWENIPQIFSAIAGRMLVDAMLAWLKMNIKSLRWKRDVVFKYIILETWLDPDFPTSHVQIENFNLVWNDRGLKNKNKTRYMQAGGVACYIHRSLISKVLFMSKILNIRQSS